RMVCDFRSRRALFFLRSRLRVRLFIGLRFFRRVVRLGLFPDLIQLGDVVPFARVEGDSDDAAEKKCEPFHSARRLAVTAPPGNKKCGTLPGAAKVVDSIFKMQAKEPTLTVNEIYESIQGESSWAGWRCVFVRLTFCDLRCSYCDTEYAFYE